MIAPLQRVLDLNNSGQNCIVRINRCRKKYMSFSSGQTKQSAISGCPIRINSMSVERGSTVVWPLPLTWTACRLAPNTNPWTLQRNYLFVDSTFFSLWTGQCDCRIPGPLHILLEKGVFPQSQSRWIFKSKWVKRVHPQSRSPRVDEYLNEVSKTSAPAVPQSQSRWIFKSKWVKWVHPQSRSPRVDEYLNLSE